MTGVTAATEAADVVVIGAGIAGVSAARTLSKAGLSVIVLEARDRTGGRILTADGFDLGAMWFWPNEARIQTLISELALGIFPQHSDGDAVYHTATGVERLDGNPIDVPSGRFQGGAESLVQAVVGDLPTGAVRLQQPVVAVQVASDTVEVQTTSTTFQGRHVILALPPALASASIRFSPKLPESLARLAAHTPVWMGGIVKIVACYGTPFWRQAGLSGSGVSHHGPIRELHDMSGPAGDPAALFGFSSAATPDQPPPTEEQVVTQLVAMFGKEAGTPSKLFIRDWRAEAWTSPPDVESLLDFQTYGHPLYGNPALDGRLHWASTETSTESPGHIEGALAAAARAATHVLEHHRRPSHGATPSHP